MRLAREVLAEIRRYFPGEVFKTAIRSNVKLAEAPSFGEHVFQYAPSSNGAADYRKLALEVIAQESGDAGLAHLPAAKPADVLVKEARARVAAEPVVELQPKAPAEPENAPAGGAVRAEDLPPLPTEAFGASSKAE